MDEVVESEMDQRSFGPLAATHWSSLALGIARHDFDMGIELAWVALPLTSGTYSNLGN